jgi:hypothetical protein
VKRAPLTASAIRKWIEGHSDIDIVRIHYCYQLGSTFVNLASMEDTIIDAMFVCDRIKVAQLLGSDAPAWESMLKKYDKLRSSTLGNLITILAKHNIQNTDLVYLRWVKEKRDFFIHRFFNDQPVAAAGHWPGELDEDTLSIMCRRLLYLEIIFFRASCRIWKIFENAGLLKRVHGVLMMNPDFVDD